MLADLNVQAAAGDLWIDPVIAGKSHAAASDWLAALRTMARSADGIGRPAGFPDLKSAKDLADKFGDKATGLEGLQTRLVQFIEVGEQLQELFLASIKKFELTDEASAKYIEDLNKPPS